MPNTPKGFPYPVPTDPVAQGAAAIRSLAEAADARTSMVMLGAQVLAADGPITFDSYPQTYSGLLLQVMARSPLAAKADSLCVRVNGDGSASSHFYVGEGGGVGEGSMAVLGAIPGTTMFDSAHEYGLFTVDFPFYSVDGFHHGWTAKGVARVDDSGVSLARSDSAGWYQATTGPIVHIQLMNPGGTLRAGSRATLWGLYGTAGGLLRDALDGREGEGPEGTPLPELPGIENELPAAPEPR